ncbi:MAG: ABC transporter ATP-binding protein [Methylococcaceae bacterium]|nr:ABC transporter ATP-binding protein [Methylococcaceae bacterium]MDZ4156120.1 ABC transporter ATP-binding protein [Methylococcales bacterium]MDP2393699.1 ABC transporter ATP-binding protein [Methylococcaceae bacterium]MDP3019725.1 ABC transporter ATP-binding protein [Methylococcaceae bacterium]MDP3390193.1 ABC transporter ATP-binding protein [Methylococcaceae bacterium]
MKPIIEVNHLTKEYQLGHITSLKESVLNTFRRLGGKPAQQRENFKALDDVNFTIEKGEVVGIIGHNGAGKSTLLKHLANISNPTKGNVIVRGSVAPLIEVGAGVNPELTGRENIFLNGAILGIPKKIIQQKLDEIIEFSELEQFIDTPVKRYSSGMTVKLGFSIATSMEADILIVDEVLAVGDIMFQQKCIERMEHLIKREGRTVLIVGHNIRQLERICSRVMLMDHGQISNDGNPSEICRIFFHEAQERTLTRHKPVEGIIPPQSDAGIIQVTNIEILDHDGNCSAHVNFHEDLTLRITFECSKKLIRPEIVVGLHTSDFVHILSVSNALADIRQDLEMGKHQLTCRLTDIPLRPSSYNLRLAFIDQHRQMLWYAENIMPVTVLPGRFNIARLPEIGLIDLATSWNFKTLSHVNGLV